MWHSLCSGNIAPMFYPLVQASIAITAYDYGQNLFLSQNEVQISGENIGAMFPREIKGHGQKISGKIVILMKTVATFKHHYMIMFITSTLF